MVVEADGGVVADVPDRSSCYLAPQVLVDVDHTMSLMVDETFGPAIGIMKVANESEGIALMNDSEFGLTASIWSGDFERVASLSEDVGTLRWHAAERRDHLS